MVAAPRRVRLTTDRDSKLPRYYYSVYDHYLSPTWSPDGKELIVVSNRGQIWGTGGFWRMRAEPSDSMQLIHFEETTWKARPDWSPDGKRVVYSSYVGTQFNQLWLMTSDGGVPFELTYGAFDATSPRWSRDARHIAYISNEGGNTALWVLDMPGAAKAKLEAKTLKFIEPVGALTVSVVDEGGKPLDARVSVTGADGRSWAPATALVHADDSFDRRERHFEVGYYHTSGASTLTVPAGIFEIEVTRGLEYAVGTAGSAGERERRDARTAHDASPRQSSRERMVQRRSARAHELRRHLSHGAEAARLHGARRGSARDRRVDREQGAASSRHLVLRQRQARPGVDTANADRARAGVSHELLGAQRVARVDEEHHSSRLRRVREHTGREPLSRERERLRSRTRAGRAHWLRASVRRDAESGGHGRARHRRAPRRRRARQGRLHGDRRLQRSSVDGRGVVSAAQLRLPDPRGRGDRCDDELRVAAWPGGNEPRVRAQREDARPRELDARDQGGTHVRDERAAAVARR